MPWWPGGPTGWIRLGNQNEPKFGLDLRPAKNVNLLKDIAVLSLSTLFSVGKNTHIAYAQT